MVEHLTVDQEVPGSNPGAPLLYPLIGMGYSFEYLVIFGRGKSDDSGKTRRRFLRVEETINK